MLSGVFTAAQINLNLRNRNLLKKLNLRKNIPTIKNLVHKLFDLRNIFNTLNIQFKTAE